MQDYFISGILDSGIIEDGGQECYREIPKTTHLIFVIVGTAITIFFYAKFKYSLAPRTNQTRQSLKTNVLEIFVAIVSTIALVLTIFMKMKTGKGIFILNPCHISILGVIVMCLSPATPFMQKIHTMWTTWLFGATLAILVPHLYGINQFEIFLYFLEHLCIVPIGPLILYRRYGFQMPNIQNQLAAFSSMALYQMIVLFPFSVLTKVNLNFALCHSPGDPLYPIFQENYFFFALFYLNFASFLCRWFYYAFVFPLKFLTKNEQQNNEIQTSKESESQF